VVFVNGWEVLRGLTAEEVAARPSPATGHYVIALDSPPFDGRVYPLSDERRELPRLEHLALLWETGGEQFLHPLDNSGYLLVGAGTMPPGSPRAGQ
jgi:hypothetical protein